jgi:hypothetical protein
VNHEVGTPQEEVQQEVTHQARRSPRTSIVTASKPPSTDSKALTSKVSRNKSRRISAQKNLIAVIIPCEVPEVVQERNTINNCLISIITNSVHGDTRHIPNDYFINKK